MERFRRRIFRFGKPVEKTVCGLVFRGFPKQFSLPSELFHK
jgi:hypothetical protein